MDLAPVVLLCRRRWNVPVLAELARSPRRFGELAAAMPASRDALSRALEAVRQAGWVAPQARQGYALTPSGGVIAEPCQEVVRVARAAHLEELLLRRWSLPVCAALQGWSLRFGELRAILAPATNRALILTLKDLIAAGLVARTLEAAYPPTASYRLTPLGAALSPPLRRIVDG